MEANERIASLETEIKALRRELVLRDCAVEEAKQSVDRRLKAMNELRDQLWTERGFYLSRNEYDVNHKALETRGDTGREVLERRITSLERWQANLTGRVIGVGSIGTVFIIIITALVTHLIK